MIRKADALYYWGEIPKTESPLKGLNSYHNDGNRLIQDIVGYRKKIHELSKVDDKKIQHLLNDLKKNSVKSIPKTRFVFEKDIIGEIKKTSNYFLRNGSKPKFDIYDTYDNNILLKRLSKNKIISDKARSVYPQTELLLNTAKQLNIPISWEDQVLQLYEMQKGEYGPESQMEGFVKPVLDSTVPKLVNDLKEEGEYLSHFVDTKQQGLKKIEEAEKIQYAYENRKEGYFKENITDDTDFWNDYLFGELYENIHNLDDKNHVKKITDYMLHRKEQKKTDYSKGPYIDNTDDKQAENESGVGLLSVENIPVEEEMEGVNESDSDYEDIPEPEEEKANIPNSKWVQQDIPESVRLRQSIIFDSKTGTTRGVEKLYNIIRKYEQEKIITPSEYPTLFQKKTKELYAVSSKVFRDLKADGLVTIIADVIQKQKAKMAQKPEPDQPPTTIRTYTPTKKGTPNKTSTPTKKGVQKKKGSMKQTPKKDKNNNK